MCAILHCWDSSGTRWRPKYNRTSLQFHIVSNFSPKWPWLFQQEAEDALSMPVLPGSCEGALRGWVNLSLLTCKHGIKSCKSSIFATDYSIIFQVMPCSAQILEAHTLCLIEYSIGEHSKDSNRAGVWSGGYSNENFRRRDMFQKKKKKKKKRKRP